jgi:hypothetical protein
VPARRDFDLTEFQTGEFAGAAPPSRRRMARVAKTARRKIQEAFWKVKNRKSFFVFFSAFCSVKENDFDGKFLIFFLFRSFTFSLFYFKTCQ